MKRLRMSHPRHQHGMAVLTVVLVLLSSLGLALAWASRGALVAQQFANNHYQAAQAHEAAVAALEEAISWTASMAAKNGYPAAGAQPATCSTINPFMGMCWQSDTLVAPFNTTDLTQAPYNATGYQRLISDRTNTIDYSAASSGAGSYATTVRIRHATDLSAINYLELTAQAVSNDSPAVTAMAHQIIYFPFLPVPPYTPPHIPMLINGCASSNLFDTFNICPEKNDGSASCSTSNPNGSTIAIGNVQPYSLFCSLVEYALGISTIITSGTNLHGGSYQMGVSPYTTVFQSMFSGLSPLQIRQASEMQARAGLTETSTPARRTIWYFAPGTNFDGVAHGTLASPAMVVVDQPAAFISLLPGNNYTVTGALYVGDTSNLSGILNTNIGGNTTVTGVFGQEGMPNTLFVSTNVIYDSGFATAMSLAARAPASGSSTARVPGSWRDW